MSRRTSRASKPSGLTPGVFDWLLDDHDNPLAGDDADPFEQFSLNDEQYRALWVSRQPELLAEARRRGLTAEEFSARAEHYTTKPAWMTK